jgi:hypothetical protein
MQYDIVATEQRILEAIQCISGRAVVILLFHHDAAKHEHRIFGIDLLPAVVARLVQKQHQTHRRPSPHAIKGCARRSVPRSPVQEGNSTRTYAAKKLKNAKRQLAQTTSRLRVSVQHQGIRRPERSALARVVAYCDPRGRYHPDIGILPNFSNLARIEP